MREHEEYERYHSQVNFNYKKNSIAIKMKEQSHKNNDENIIYNSDFKIMTTIIIINYNNSNNK